MGYPDNILHKVIKPAQYTGGEWNSVEKDWDRTDIKIALAYPDLYEVGMSNLAVLILYDLLNRQPAVLAERVYALGRDMEAEIRQANIPLVSLETKHPLKEFDIIGFSLGYELTYTNVLNMLDMAGIPVFAEERDDSYPLVIAGGTCSLNPEPMSDFIDLFVIGDGEDVTLDLVAVFREWKANGGHKSQLLKRLASIPGIYVPSFYKVGYSSDGLLSCISPVVPEANTVIRRCVIEKLPPSLVKPVVPFIETIHDRGTVEIHRGCTRSCRFCQAGMVYRPHRYRSHDEIFDAVDSLVENCGYNEVSLLSLSTSDHPEIADLVGKLTRRRHTNPVFFSLPSLRMDSFSVELMDSLCLGKKPGLTFAPEAGSERLRHAINKPLPEEDMLKTVTTALDKGWTGFKLYFMVGLPTETEDDVRAIGALVQKVRQIRRGKSQPRIKVNLASFVPKTHTPFQWVPQDNPDVLEAKQNIVTQELRRLGVKVSWHDPRVSLLEAVIARGDRRIGKVIYRAWQLGCVLDAWTEYYNHEKWLQAFDETGIDPSFYANRQRSLDEVLPWSHIDSGVTVSFLKREYQRTFEARITPDCRQGKCNACGLEAIHPECQRRFQDV